MKKTLIVLLAALLVLGCTVALADDFNPVCPICHANPANAYLSCSGGDYVYYCPTCAVGAGIKAGSTKAEHTWVANGEAVAPTCIAAGYTPMKCGVCGTTKNFETAAPLGHNWTDAEAFIISQPTCTKPGTQSYTCTNPNCPKEGGHVIYEQIPALGHVYKCGDIEYTESEVDKAVKNYITDATTPADFADDWKGLTQNGLYVKPNCMTAGGACVYCSVCDTMHKVALAKTAHVWDPTHSVTTNSTCIKYGSTKRICQICGQIVTERLPLAPHAWATNKVTNTIWFELGDDMAYKKCTVCGQYEVYANYKDTAKCNLVGITKGKPAENIGTLTDNNPSMTQPNKDNVKGAKKASTAAAKASAASTKANANGVSIPATNDTTSTVPFVMMGIALVGIVALIASKRKVNG